MAVLALAVASCALTPGDKLLALATTEYEGTSPEDVIGRTNAVLRHLGLPPLENGPHRGATSARFEKAPAYEERVELANTIMVVRGSAKFGYVHDAIIIADGEVRIGSAARSIVVARGSITISGELGELVSGANPGGMYFSKGAIRFSNCRSPTLYAVKGASTPCAAKAFNTEISQGSTRYIGTIRYMGGPPLFDGEPPSGMQRMVISTGESMSYSGTRCDGGHNLVSLHTTLLREVRARANCPLIDAAFVSCGRAPSGDPREKWTFSACGKTVSMYASANDVPLPPGADGAAHRSVEISSEDDLRSRECKKSDRGPLRGPDGGIPREPVICPDRR